MSVCFLVHSTYLEPECAFHYKSEDLFVSEDMICLEGVFEGSGSRVGARIRRTTRIRVCVTPLCSREKGELFISPFSSFS